MKTIPIKLLQVTTFCICFWGFQANATENYADTLLFIPSGTHILIETQEYLNTGSSYFGKSFKARLDAPIMKGDQVMIPAGTEFRGVISASERAGNMGGRAYLALELEKMEFGDIWVPIRTDRLGFTGNSSDTGIKTGVGAGIGAVVGGFKWAVRGALVGLGISAVTPGKQIDIPEGTELEFFLEEDLLVIDDRL